MVAERDWAKGGNRCSGFLDGPPDDPDDDWTEQPAPEWPTLLRFMRHRAETLLRMHPMDDPAFFGGMMEALIRLSAMEEKYGTDE